MKIVEKIFLYGWIGGMFVVMAGYLLIIVYLGLSMIIGLFIKPVTTKNVSISNESMLIATTPTPIIFKVPVNLPTFGGDDCTVDCSGHEAGSRWAEEHDITDPDDCGGKSQSFIEGCQSYAEEN